MIPSRPSRRGTGDHEPLLWAILIRASASPALAAVGDAGRVAEPIVPPVQGEIHVAEQGAIRLAALVLSVTPPEVGAPVSIRFSVHATPHEVPAQVAIHFWEQEPHAIRPEAPGQAAIRHETRESDGAQREAQGQREVPSLVSPGAQVAIPSASPT